MKIIKCWKRLSHDCGYQNDTSGQIVVISRKEFSRNYHVQLLECGQTEGKVISPEYPTRAKADVFAVDWMLKHPKGS